MCFSKKAQEQKKVLEYLTTLRWKYLLGCHSGVMQKPAFYHFVWQKNLFVSEKNEFFFFILFLYNI